MLERAPTAIRAPLSHSTSRLDFPWCVTSKAFVVCSMSHLTSVLRNSPALASYVALACPEAVVDSSVAAAYFFREWLKVSSIPASLKKTSSAFLSSLKDGGSQG